MTRRPYVSARTAAYRAGERAAAAGRGRDENPHRQPYAAAERAAWWSGFDAVLADGAQPAGRPDADADTTPTTDHRS